MFLASLARASRPQLISRGSPLHIFSAGAGVDRLARRCATRRLLCAQAQPAQSGEADEASPPPPTRVNFRQPMLATRPSMTAHARWLRMDAALKIVAAEGCSLEEAEDGQSKRKPASLRSVSSLHMGDDDEGGDGDGEKAVPPAAKASRQSEAPGKAPEAGVLATQGGDSDAGANASAPAAADPPTTTR